MVKHRRILLKKFTCWLLLALFLLPVLTFGLWYGRQVRQQQLDHALIEAIKKNETQKAIALLDEGANANAVDKPYQPMTLAGLWADIKKKIQGQQEEQAVYTPALLLPYRNMNVADDKENPTLITALLEHGANPSAVNERGFNILSCAVLCDHEATVHILLDHHADPNQVCKKKFQMLLLPGAKSKTPYIFYDEEPPLIGASYNCTRLLVEYGADVNCSSSNGTTPLIASEAVDVSKLLLEHKANINAQDEEGKTALFLKTDPQLVRLLLQYGAKVSHKDRQGLTALDYARRDKEAYPLVIPFLEAALQKEQAEQHPTGSGIK